MLEALEVQRLDDTSREADEIVRIQGLWWLPCLRAADGRREGPFVTLDYHLPSRLLRRCPPGCFTSDEHSQNQTSREVKVAGVWLEGCFGLSWVDKIFKAWREAWEELGYIWDSIQILFRVPDCLHMKRKAQEWLVVYFFWLTFYCHSLMTVYI